MIPAHEFIEEERIPIYADHIRVETLSGPRDTTSKAIADCIAVHIDEFASFDMDRIKLTIEADFLRRELQAARRKAFVTSIY